MAAIYSNGGNRWNILGFNFTKRDALSSVYKISMVSDNLAPRPFHRWKALGMRLLLRCFCSFFLFCRFSLQRKSFPCIEVMSHPRNIT